jgi:diacylglycerol kinase family enzyme
MVKKALIIFNPSAGLRSKLAVEKLAEHKLKSLGYRVDIFLVDEHFEAGLNGYDFSNLSLVAAIGGDGTVKVAGRTIIENKSNAPLVIIPFGSANVIAKSLGIPLNAKTALRLISGSQLRNLDVGIINKTHYFLVGFSVGYISRIVTGTSTKLKNRFGFIGYLINLLFNVNKIKRQKFLVRTKNHKFWLKGNSLVVFNACNFYGIKSKKKIDPSDGIFNLYVVTNRNFWSLCIAMLQFVFYGRPTQFLFSLDNNYFKISLSRRLRSCQIDGDYIELNQDIEIKMLPQALKVVVGK